MSKKHGFTLVELSIVLVIIGLLIGGILAAQSMIGTAKIQSFIRQVGQFDAAVENFQTKYNGLPGDTSIMGCVSHYDNTCDNGQIDYGAGDFGDNPGFGSEVGNFWYNLSESGLTGSKNSTYTSCVNNCGTPIPGTDLPISPFNNKEGWIAICWHYSSSYNYYAAGYNWENSIDDLDSSVKPSQMLAIDTKIDDGKDGDFGTNVFSINAYSSSSGGSQYPNACNDGNGNYNVANDSTARCIPYIRIGISTGDLK